MLFTADIQLIDDTDIDTDSYTKYKPQSGKTDRNTIVDSLKPSHSSSPKSTIHNPTNP